MLLQFYSTATDFRRRLVSVKANAKFSSPEADADADCTKEVENLAEVVKYIKSEFDVK